MPPETSQSPNPKGERIAKIMSRAGLCSRREAERWITDGRVTMDGEVLKPPAVKVTAANNIKVDRKSLPQAETTRLCRYHTPTGLLTTHKDTDGRPTVFQSLPDTLPRLISVGRLDLNSEGLLLLTNDGELARKLELPATGWRRRYRVRVHGRVQADALFSLEDGLNIAGIKYGPIKARLERQQGANAWLSVSLTEGKNREIRTVMEHMGWPVSRLIRVSYGPFQLGHLAKGEIDEIKQKTLREQLGLNPVKDRSRAHRRR